MQDLIKRARKYSKSDSIVLIEGATGIGKELFAHSIHNYNLRANKAFVAINCAALPENLLESELFGYYNNKNIY
jgi:transcriptional regulator with PAS, ATPase and Fis domain